MLRRGGFHAGMAVFAALDMIVIVAPSVVLALVARKGGLPDTHGLDLVIASTVLGAGHAFFVSHRLRRELQHGARVVDEIIATFISLVVLAAGATGLFIFVLGGFARAHAALINRGWPTLAMWIGVTLAAVSLAEVARSQVFRWLEPEFRDEPLEPSSDDSRELSSDSESTPQDEPATAVRR